VNRIPLASVEPTLLNSEAWPSVNLDVLDDAARDLVKRRSRAVELVIAKSSAAKILSETNITRRMAVYWFKRCLEVHPDGRIYGFRILIAYSGRSGPVIPRQVVH